MLLNLRDLILVLPPEHLLLPSQTLLDAGGVRGGLCYSVGYKVIYVVLLVVLSVVLNYV
jgi:hypothetical protein